MSINVTVTGNPVSINRGRMVTACKCKDAQREEFEKRRLMRLEQVRQQSKEIAENVRNKVRNEKKKQCSLFEKESEKKLKDWQARKLLELQNQYQQNLKDIGLGHKEAEIFDSIEEDVKTRKNYQAKIAAKRGQIAKEKLKSVSAQRSVEKAHCCTCSPKKLCYTLIDNTGTPIFITPKTDIGEQSGQSTSSTAKRQTSELSDTSEETTSSISENFDGISGGSSPRRPSPQYSTNDVEKFAGESVRAGTSGLGRHRGSKQDIISSRFRGETIDEVTEDASEESGPQKTTATLHKEKSSKRKADRDIRKGNITQSRIKSQEDATDENVEVQNNTSKSRSQRVDLTAEKQRKCGKTVENKSNKYGSEERPLTPKIHEKNKEKQESSKSLSQMKTKDRDKSLRKSAENHTKQLVVDDTIKDVKSKSQESRQKSLEKEQVEESLDDNSEVSDELLKSKTQKANVVSERERDTKRGRNKEKSLGESPTRTTGVDESGRFPSNKTKNSDFMVLTDDSEDFVESQSKGMDGQRGNNYRSSQAIRQTSGRYTALSDDHITKTDSSIRYPIETRISDRIKHRSSTVTHSECYDEINKETPRPVIPSNPDLQKPIDRKDTDVQVAPTVTQKAQTTNLDGISEKASTSKRQEDDDMILNKGGKIPEKPTVILKQNSGRTTTKGHVEKIAEDDLEIQPMDYGMEKDFLKRIERQDREAEERGRIALQKEKTRRSYEEMMRKLPILQKQERLSRLNIEKPEYYMSEERLKEMEKKRQLEIENAFENAFPNLKPNIITSEIVEKEPDETRGTWDVTRGRRKEVKCACCPKQTKRERQLKDLLINLQAQKEMLLQEVNALPKDSKLNELLSSLHNINTKKKTENKRRLREISPTSGSSASPRKKAKTKTKKYVLVRQNMSTQTSPDVQSGGEVQKVERATSPVVKSPEKLEDKTSEKVEQKIDKATEISEDKNLKEKPICYEDEKLCEIVIKIRENELEPEIFVEKPNKNVDVVSEATAKKTDKVVTKEKKRKRNVTVESHTWRDQFSQNSTNYTSSSTSYYSPPDVSSKQKHQPRLRDVLQNKEKQTNFAARTTQTERKLHPFIIKYIERLLTISRSAVEELSVSSVSDITTPASSIIDINSNNPTLNHLKKLLKRLGISYDEMQEIYGKSGKHDAVLSSLSSSSTHSNEIEIRHQANQGNYESQEEQTNTTLSAKVSQDDTLDEDDAKYREMMLKYAEITESCNKKISDLTEKIEKVRMEKMQIMNSSNSSGNDKENTTTAYLNLPNTSGSSSSEQEKLDKMLLTIDQTLAENLKRMTASEIREKYDPIDVEEQPQDFEPLLKDIPKLPKFTETYDSTKCNNKRPPPSKGLTVAKRFNDEITGIPHELSTIMEGDSQISTKAQKSHEDIANRSTKIGTPDILKEISDNKEKSKKQTSFDRQIQVQHLSSSSDEIESLEKMLKDMGMGWAIATLRKTQEALALTSSSSSIDINIQQQKVYSDSSGSEVNLKGILSRHLLAKISSTSTSTSETSISLLMKEFDDISAILGSGSTIKDGHRTSTPVQQVSNKNKQCNCSDRSDGSNNKGNCTFHSLQSSNSVSK